MTSKLRNLFKQKIYCNLLPNHLIRNNKKRHDIFLKHIGDRIRKVKNNMSLLILYMK
jgi:hypothetical protein